MKTNKLLFAITGVLVAFTFFYACKKDKDPGYGNISIRLTDSPGLYQQVNVDIQTVSVHLVPTAGSGSWIDLPTKSGVYDLLKLQNGIDTSLVNTTSLSAGKITQMRLLLGTNNTVMKDSVVYNLTVPSGSQTGIKVIGNLIIDPNIPLNVKLDFDAAESVVESGTNTYQLKPTIKTL
jgi:hypothetical protein